MIEVNYNEYKETIAQNMKLVVENHDLKQEIERLNNIIRELEKWLKGGNIIDFDLNFQVLAVKDILNKLQELKGVDKE